MTKFQTIRCYSAVIAVSGLLYLLYHPQPSLENRIKWSLLLLIGVWFAALTAVKIKNIQVRFKYHELHALSLAVLAVFVCFTDYTYVTIPQALLVFCCSFAGIEILFNYWLFHLHLPLNGKVLIIRGIAAALVLVLSILLLTLPMLSSNTVNTGAASVLIVLSLFPLLYIPLLKKLERPMNPILL